VNKKEGARILKEITLHPFLGKKDFWKQSPEEFKNANSFGLWKEHSIGKGNLTLTIENPNGITLWGLAPVIITVKYKNNELNWIKMNLWNKGDSTYSLHQPVLKTCKDIKRRLLDSGFSKEDKKEKVSSFYKRKWESFKLGPTVLSFSHKEYEYFFVMLEPAGKKIEKIDKRKEFLNSRKDPKKEFLERIKKHVKKEKNGDVTIEGIPMIDQGKKGYCAPATCARVLIHYGIDVDMHLVAEMMNTAEKGSGTAGNDLEYSLRRLCRDNPFKFKKFHSFRERLVKKYIDLGMPVIWSVPGHLRLIIGYNEKEKQIIYSDTWGEWAAKRKMPYKQAESLTRNLFILK
jgi:hypothetical protein